MSPSISASRRAQAIRVFAVSTTTSPLGGNHLATDQQVGPCRSASTQCSMRRFSPVRGWSVVADHSPPACSCFEIEADVGDYVLYGFVFVESAAYRVIGCGRPSMPTRT
jgi:hypothetical protein